ncbi:MAG: DUF6868 family protein [Phycisphaerales bacterium]
MTFDQIHEALLWCTLINFAILLFWFALLVFARGWIRRIHGKWFRLSDERFDSLHYGLMGAYELGIFLFCLVPYVALHVVR